MNAREAKKLLELPDEWDETILKKHYHKLAIKYHPDKSKDPGANEKFAKIHEAYQTLNKNENVSPDIGNFFAEGLQNIFKEFVFKVHTNTKPPPPPQPTTISIKLTGEEYFNGTKKQIDVPTRCTCELCICMSCAGCGFNTLSHILSVCMECLGEGCIQSCRKCVNGMTTAKKIVNLPSKPDLSKGYIDPEIGILKIQLHEPYFYYQNKIYLNYDITLKESLIGFTKEYTDPYGNKQNIVVKNIIQPNDGYLIKSIGLILKFNVLYPTRLSPKTIQQLNELVF